MSGHTWATRVHTYPILGDARSRSGWNGPVHEYGRRNQEETCATVAAIAYI